MTPVTATFCVVAMRRGHSNHIGNSKMMISVATFMDALIKKVSPVMHVPGMLRSQNRAIGTQ